MKHEINQFPGCSVLLSRLVSNRSDSGMAFKSESTIRCNPVYLAALKQITNLQENLLEIQRQQISLKSEIEAAKLQLDKLQSEVDKLQSELDVERKKCVKQQVDLKDLRNQFQEKSARESALVELLVELQGKLENASDLFSLLRESHPEITTIDLG